VDFECFPTLEGYPPGVDKPTDFLDYNLDKLIRIKF
jgi:hypothetical protein